MLYSTSPLKIKSKELPYLSNELTEMSEFSRRQFWSELEGDATFDTLQAGAMGWLPNKPERVTTKARGHSICVLVRGKGSFLSAGKREPEEVEGPGVMFISFGNDRDYGPVNGSLWDEFFWGFSGSRLSDWERFAWWPQSPCFRKIDSETLAALWQLFVEGVAAVEHRDGQALNLHKLALEKWLCEQAYRTGERSPLERVVESWRRAPQRVWSLQEAAASVGQSYTRFRVEFLRQYQTSPYDYLLRLRLELAANWLRGTNEPVKNIAFRCGFQHLETFLRAFARIYGTSPRRWRNQPP